MSIRNVLFLSSYVSSGTSLQALRAAERSSGSHIVPSGLVNHSFDAFGDRCCKLENTGAETLFFTGSQSQVDCRDHLLTATRGNYDIFPFTSILGLFFLSTDNMASGCITFSVKLFSVNFIEHYRPRLSEIRRLLSGCRR